MDKIRIGLLGTGLIGRQIYKLATESEYFEIIAIADNTEPEIIRHLINADLPLASRTYLEGKYLINKNNKTHILQSSNSNEIPWGSFDIDFIIDTIGQCSTRSGLQQHIDNGAKRIILASFPTEDIDRVILFGINENDIKREDKIISSGSETATAAALAIKILTSKYDIEHVSFTSVHTYNNDEQQKHVANNGFPATLYGAHNIFPSSTPALSWIQKLLPQTEGLMTAYALSTPVQHGSMLDMSFSMRTPNRDLIEFKKAYIEYTNSNPNLVGFSEDPIVSSDVISSPLSLLVDLKGSMRVGTRLFKLIGWHGSLGHAHRITQLMVNYSDIDKADHAEVL